ncbi:MAG: hypothetical protein LBQ28_03440 [Prevotellaceae bacterium]|jgi:hypothetical protein|nr:hypothetical protein [Prevotellaceae bacterium]
MKTIKVFLFSVLIFSGTTVDVSAQSWLKKALDKVDNAVKSISNTSSAEKKEAEQQQQSVNNQELSQSRIVIDQSSNAVKFTNDNKTWGLEVNGNKLLVPIFKTIGFQNGLFKIEKDDGTWNVCDKTGAMQLDWIPASDVKITEKHVLFEKANGGVEALIYNRADWTVTKATEITYDDMYKEVEKANADKGTKIHGYESLGALNIRLVSTIPHYIAPKAGRKAVIKRGSNEIVSWTGTGKWLNPHESIAGWPSGTFPNLGEDPYRETPTELYFLAHDTEKKCSYILWVEADESDKYFIQINGEKRGYVKITPSQLHPTRLMMCQTEDGVEHPVWVWGPPLINRVVPNDSWTSAEKTKKREELAKAHLNCTHCIEQSRIYDEKNKK